MVEDRRLGDDGLFGALVAGSGRWPARSPSSARQGRCRSDGRAHPDFRAGKREQGRDQVRGRPQIYGQLRDGAASTSLSRMKMDRGFVKRGEIAGGSEIMLSRVGIAVRAGAPKPDIGTADALKEALIAAKSVAYSQDASGRHFVSAISRLKLANTLGPKSIIVLGVGATLASGEAEIGGQQIAELLPVPGIDIVGPLPGDLQKIIVYVAGVPANTRVPEAVKALVTFLTSEAAATVLKQKGMDPPTIPLWNLF